MVLPSSGKIGLSHLRDELGGPATGGKIALSDYVRNGSYGAVVAVSPCNIPSTTSMVGLSKYYAAAKWQYPTSNYPCVHMTSAPYPSWSVTNMDANAKHVWIDPLQSIAAPIVNYPISFYYIYQNTSGQAQSGTLYTMQDDTANIYINTSNVANYTTYTGSTNALTSTMQVGQNLLKCTVTNTGSSGTFISTFTKASGGTAIATSSNWVCDAQCDVHYNSWHTSMTAYHGSGFTLTKAGSDPDVQYQLGNSVGSTLNTVYLSKRIQDYSSFVLYFEIYIAANSVADAMYFFCGTNTANVMEGTAANGFILAFQIYTGGGLSQGIYLRRGDAAVVASYGTSGFLASAWQSVAVYYTRGTTNTWSINWNGTNVITYSDPNNASYIANSGSYWGFGFRDGGAVGSAWVRRVQLYHR